MATTKSPSSTTKSKEKARSSTGSSSAPNKQPVVRQQEDNGGGDDDKKELLEDAITNTTTPSAAASLLKTPKTAAKDDNNKKTADAAAAMTDDDHSSKKETSTNKEKHEDLSSPSSKPKGRTRSSSGGISMELYGEMCSSSPVVSDKKKNGKQRSSSVGSTGSSASGGTSKRRGKRSDEKVTETAVSGKGTTEEAVEKSQTPVVSNKKKNRKRSSSMGSTGSTRKLDQEKATPSGDEKGAVAAASGKATATNNDQALSPKQPPSSPKRQGRARSSSGASMVDMLPGVADDDSKKAIDNKKDQQSNFSKKATTAAGGRKRSASLGSIGGGDATAKGAAGRESKSQKKKTRNRARSLSGGSSKELLEKKAASAAAISAKDDYKTAAATVSPKKKHKTNHPSSSPGQQKQAKSSTSKNKKNAQQENKDKQQQQQQRSKQKASPPPQKRAPTMDVLVHRIRHFNYQPTEIVCMRATPPPPGLLSSDKTSTRNHRDYNLLAISRGNGSVELHAMNEKARIIATIAGFHDEQRHVNTMTWLCGTSTSTDGNDIEPPTLIGASPDGSIFIADFGNSQFSAMISSGGGGVFALTSLGQRNSGGKSDRESCDGLVAAGCQDGCVRILQCKTDHQGRRRLEIVSTLPSASAAVLSVAWQPRSKHMNGGADSMDVDDDDSNINDMVGSVLYAGIADGTIRRYDCLGAADGGAFDDGSNSSCRWKASHRMTVESHGRQIPTRIWALEYLQDGTVISGDSLGHVQFWDGHTGSLLQSLDQTDTKADVLDIAVSADECKVFCSGVDSRVICIERKQKQAQDGMMDVDDGDDDDYRPWILSNAHRPHTHDVKAVTMCRELVMSTDASGQEQVSVAEILCTGGVDTKLCTYSVANFQRQRPRIIYPWPSFSPVSVASRARLVSFMRDDCVDVYRLEKKSPPGKVREPVMVPDEETLVGTVKVKGPSALVCSTLSDNGQFLVVSDGTVIYLFSIALGKDNASFSASRLSIDLPTPLSVVSAKFIRDDCLLLAATDGRLVVLEFREAGSGDEMEVDGSSESTNQKVIVSVKQIIEPEKEEQSHHTSLSVHSIISTSCGKWFATVRNEIGSEGKVEIYSTGGGNELFRREWVLPKLDSPVSAITFLGSKRPQLAVACVNFALYVFDIMGHRLNTWSEAAGFPLSTSIPADLSSRRDFPVRLSADQTCPSKVLMVSGGAVFQ
jgi:hypothetical protein